MKEMNSLEMHLRSWVPRPPSASLKQRLFPHIPAAPFLARFRWVAPALTCVLLGIALVHQESSLPTGGARLGTGLTVAASNLTSSASLSNDIERAGSNLPAGLFEYTNRSAATSCFGAVLPVELN